MGKDKIIYYSKFCKNSDKIIKILSRSSVKDYIHFIPIDKREINQGKITIFLDNGDTVILPQNIKKVPAMLLLHAGNRILFGDEILHFFRDDFDKERKTSTNKNGEPTLVTDNISLTYLAGSEINWNEDLNGATFSIDNPNATSSCGCGSSFSVT